VAAHRRSTGDLLGHASELVRAERTRRRPIVAASI
jgi:hypothetical protein